MSGLRSARRLNNHNNNENLAYALCVHIMKPYYLYFFYFSIFHIYTRIVFFRNVVCAKHWKNQTSRLCND